MYFFYSCIVHTFHVKSLACKIRNVLANGDSSFIVSVEGCIYICSTNLLICIHTRNGCGLIRKWARQNRSFSFEPETDMSKSNYWTCYLPVVLQQ